MEQELLQAFTMVFTLEALLYLALGVFIGGAFAAIPGLTGTLALSLVLPFTFFISVVPALALLLGTYKGCMFGGSVSAVTFGVPGDAPAAPTAFDGFPLARQGKANKALSIALYASITGNFLADLILIFTLVPVSYIALRFGPRELCALMFLALMSLALLFGGSVRKGLFAIMLGGFMATIGSDPISSIPRMTFGFMALRDGLPLVAVITGLFAFSELLIQFGQGMRDFLEKKEQQFKQLSQITKRSPDDRLTFREYLACWREMLVGSIIGICLGALPGPGAAMSAFTAYGIAGGWKKNKGRFGTGMVEGVAAPESANSATVGPTLIPLLTFGIPGSGNAALFGAALMLQGITAGPGLFTDYLHIIYAIFILMIVGTAMNLFISKFTIIPIFSRLAMVERRLLLALLTPMMAIGIYSINLRPFDVLVMFLSGILGLLLRRVNITLAPVAVAMIVIPLFETQFRRALLLGHGDFMYFFQSPLACGLLLMSVALSVYVYLKNTK